MTIKVEGASLLLTRTVEGSVAQEVRRVQLGSDIRIDRAQLNDQSVDTTSWEWSVYPDGSSDRGGLQFRVERRTMSLRLSADGDVRWETGSLPDPGRDRWQAGESTTSTTSATAK
jgi:hypothetical protein